MSVQRDPRFGVSTCRELFSRGRSCVELRGRATSPRRGGADQGVALHPDGVTDSVQHQHQDHT